MSADMLDVIPSRTAQNPSGPFTQPDGHDAPGLIDQPVQGVAAVIDDVVIGCEDEIGEPVVAEELPDIFVGFSSGHFAGSGTGGEFFWQTCASSPNQNSKCLPRASPAAISASAAGKVFFKCLDGVGTLGMMALPGRQLVIAELARLTAQRDEADRTVEFVPDPLRGNDQLPADHAVHRRHRPGLDDLHQRTAQFVVEARRRAGQLPVDPSVRPLGVEPQIPVPGDLPPSDPLRAASSVVDRCQRQQTARLVRVPRPPSQTPEIINRKVQTQRNRHHHSEHLPFAELRNHKSAAKGVLLRVSCHGGWHEPELMRLQQAMFKQPEDGLSRSHNGRKKCHAEAIVVGSGSSYASKRSALEDGCVSGNNVPHGVVEALSAKLLLCPS